MPMNQNVSYEDEIDLRELFITLKKNKKIIFIVTTLVTLLAIVYVMIKTPIYEVKSNVQVGFIGDNLVIEPDTLVKTVNIVFNVEDKLNTKKEFVSEVSSVSINKKLKNFITIKTQGISNEEALKKNKEVVKYIQNLTHKKVEQYIRNKQYAIKAVETKIKNLDELEKKNLQREIDLIKNQQIVKIDEKIKRLKEQDIKNLQRKIDLLKSQDIVKIDDQIKRLKEQDIKNLQRKIDLLKSQDIVKIDDQIKFYKKVKIPTLQEKIKFHTEKLAEYTKAVKKLYQDNIRSKDSTASTISSIQMVNYQNLILNSQNKIEDLKVEIEKINSEVIPNLQRQKDNIKNVTIKNLQLQIDNIKNVTIKDLLRQKDNIKNVTIKNLQLQIDNIKNVTIKDLQRSENNLESDTLRKLEYKLKVSLPNKRKKLQEQIEKLKFDMDEQNVKNSEVVGEYIIKDYPVKPKKILVVLVALITGLILSIFLVFFREFLKSFK